MQVRMKKFDPIPSGTYPAVVDSIEAKTGRYGPTFNITFKITQDTGTTKAGSSITGLVSQNLTTKSKLAKWLTAMGIVLEVDQNFELDQIVGKVVTIEVVINGDFSNVADVKSPGVAEVFQQQSSPTPASAATLAAAPPIPSTAPLNVPPQANVPDLGEEDILF